MNQKDYIPAAHAIVAFNGKILLLHRDNDPKINDPDCWSLLGGLVKKGESFEETI